MPIISAALTALALTLSRAGICAQKISLDGIERHVTSTHTHQRNAFFYLAERDRRNWKRMGRSNTSALRSSSSSPSWGTKRGHYYTSAITLPSSPPPPPSQKRSTEEEMRSAFFPTRSFHVSPSLVPFFVSRRRQQKRMEPEKQFGNSLWATLSSTTADCYKFFSDRKPDAPPQKEMVNGLLVSLRRWEGGRGYRSEEHLAFSGALMVTLPRAYRTRERSL